MAATGAPLDERKADRSPLPCLASRCLPAASGPLLCLLGSPPGESKWRRPARARMPPLGTSLNTANPRWELWGVLLGLGTGCFDLGLFWLLGERLHLSRAATVGWVTLWFAVCCAALGFVIGRLMRARRREQADGQLIRDQMAALAASQQLALQNEKIAAIGSLAAGIAHEVRNPLGVIRASASMVQESFKPGEDAHRACQFICEEIDRLNGLIAALLAFARPAPLRMQRVALDSVLERALGLAADELRGRGVSVAQEGAKRVELDGDPDLLSQVVLSLLTNAVEALDASPTARGQIAVRVATAAETVQLEIADSGPGLLPEHATRVFEPFFTTKAKGTGLGLAMALRIVQAHRGVLEVVPGRGAGSAGAGACFRLRLPLHASVELRGQELAA